MTRLLVTGGAGFIGANFIYHWLKRHEQDHIIILDKLTYAGCKASLESALQTANCFFYQGDIGDKALVSAILERHQIDRVVNFAAESHVDRSIVGPDTFIQTNVVGTHNLLQACKDFWLGQGSGKAHRFHHVSTDEVYGSLSPEAPPFTEQTPYQPNSPYSASKAASDHLVRAYHHTYGLNVSTSNCSNNYGPYHFPEKLIPLCITNVLQGLPLPIYGDGKNVRDWLYVEDHCRGIATILENGGNGETYNIGGNNEWDNLSLVEKICERMDYKAQLGLIQREQFPKAAVFSNDGARQAITFVRDRPGHDRRYAIDATKIEKNLGFRASVDLEKGLDLTIDWYLENEAWWRPLLTKARLG